MKKISFENSLSIKRLLVFTFYTFSASSFTLFAQNPIFYGYTQQGGANGYGNIFKYAPGAGNYDDAVEFTGATGSAPGALPNLGHLVQATDGNLYGVTGGSTNNGGKGNIFKYNPTTSVFTNLINFTGDTGTANPGAGGIGIMQASDGNFYGMTDGGGYGEGEIFRYNPNTNIFTDLFNFNGDSGAYPNGGLIQATDGKLYGVTYAGGFENAGVLFSYNINTGAFTRLDTFTRTSGPYPGAAPQGTLLQASDGNIYGTCANGGTDNEGTLFQYNPTSGVLTTMFNFTGSSGSYQGGYSNSGIIQATDGNLYGMTQSEGGSGNGNIYQYNYTTGSFISIVNFTGTTGSFIGEGPTGALIQASDGNLYGMTSEQNYYYGISSPPGNGTIFEYNMSTFLFSNLVNFTGAAGPFTGAIPFGDLTEDTRCSLTASAAATANVSCDGGTDGNASATVSGGTAPYTFSWSNGGTSAVSTSGSTGPILSAGTYTLTVKDHAGICTQTALVDITQPATLSLTTSVVNNSCAGGNNGNANVNISGGAAPFNYTWINSSSSVVSTSNPTGAILSQGSYTVTVSDNCGSSQTASVSILESAPISFSISSQTNIKCNGAATGKITAKAATGGASPYQYNWSPGGGTNLTFSDLSAGTYTITATDSHGCTASISATLTEPAAIRDSLVNGTSAGPTCYGGDNGTATIGVTGGVTPYTYTWSSLVSTTATATTLKGENYIVTVRDKNGCLQEVVFLVTQPLAIRDSIVAISKQNITCNGANNGSATVGAKFGTLPYAYNWSPSGGTNATASNLSAGTYTVHIGDANGCTASTSTSITQPAILRDSMISADIVNIKCNGSSTGSAMVGVKGGSTPYTYAWSPLTGTTSKLTGMSALTTYSVHVTDKNGCTTSATIVLTQPAALSASVSGAITGPTCYGGDNGSANIAASGGTTPYTYTWTSSVSTTATATVLKAQTYTVTVKDKNNCSLAVVFTVTQPLAIRDSIITASKVNESCNGESNGSATAGAKFGTTPYTYNWQPNGGTNHTASGLSAGIYTVHITDVKGCTATASTTITQPAILRDSISTFSCSGSNTTATAGVKGGTTPFTYLWMPGGGTKSTMTGLSNGTYTITVTDKNGCSAFNTKTFDCALAPPKEDGEYQEPLCCQLSENISLFPNPNTGQFTIGGLESGMIIEIYDYTGRRISLQSKIGNEQLTINLNNQPNGIYLVRIISKDGTLVSEKKVVKTK